MGRSARQKGKRVEREAVQACRELFSSPSTCRRSRQSDGQHDPDIHDAVPGASFEIKGRKRFSVLRFWEQSARDAKEGEVPVVMLREDGEKDFFILLKAKDLRQFWEGVLINELGKSQGLP